MAYPAVAKAGMVGIVGVYPQTVVSWPIGIGGQLPHRALIPRLIDIVG